MNEHPAEDWLEEQTHPMARETLKLIRTLREMGTHIRPGAKISCQYRELKYVSFVVGSIQEVECEYTNPPGMTGPAEHDSISYADLQLTIRINVMDAETLHHDAQG